MQTYANFTVGGALSVNCHGRYMGLGPVVLSVRSIDVLLADGSLVRAGRTENSDIFAGMIGGYNSVGIITAVEFDLDDNVKVKQVSKKMKKNQYFQFFKYSVREDKKVIFHNADIYPPKYENIRSVSWEFTLDKPTVKSRFMPLQASYPIHRYFSGTLQSHHLENGDVNTLLIPFSFWPKKCTGGITRLGMTF